MNESTAVAIPVSAFLEKWKKEMLGYDEKKYLVLAPIELGPIPPEHTPHATVLKIDPSPEAGDVYEIQGKFAYTKAALDRIATAAGISWLPEVCGRTDAGQDPEIVRFRMGGKRKELDGQWLEVVREYEFDLTSRQAELEDSVPKRKWIVDITDKAKKEKAIADTVAKDMVQLRKFKVQRAETGAANRVVRVFLGIKANYTRDQIARALVVPKLVYTPDFTDPEVREFYRAVQSGTTRELYAAYARAGWHDHPIVVHESPGEIAERKREALPAIIDVSPEDATQPKAGAEGPAPAAGEGHAEGPPPPPDAVLKFDEAYQMETKAGSDEVKYGAIADQLAALKSLMERKGFEAKGLKKPLEQFTREQRLAFCNHLKAMEDVQLALPW